MTLQEQIEQQYGVPGGPDVAPEFRLYVSTDKDSNWERLSNPHDLGQYQLSNDAERTFVYTGYEVELACTLNRKTGRATAYGIVSGAEVVRFAKPVGV